MTGDNLKARFAGAMFVTASLAGGTLIQTVLGRPDAADQLRPDRG